MKPLPWSFSSLDTFKNCPFQYYHKNVIKSFKEEKTPQMIWGERVHKDFEDRLAHDKPLPIDLTDHEPYLAKLEALGGILNTEQKIAINKQMQPCDFFGQDVWMRGIIDLSVIFASTGIIVDYKTGKPHTKPHQLALFGIWAFAKYPFLEAIKTEFYWTKTCGTTENQYVRDDLADMWGMFMSDLTQYKEAFHTDTWQKRPSGLCNGWCGVRTCEHWKPKR